MNVQAGLCLCYSHATKSGFLAVWHKWFSNIKMHYLRIKMSNVNHLLILKKRKDHSLNLKIVCCENLKNSSRKVLSLFKNKIHGLDMNCS